MQRLALSQEGVEISVQQVPLRLFPACASPCTQCVSPAHSMLAQPEHARHGSSKVFDQARLCYGKCALLCCERAKRVLICMIVLASRPERCQTSLKSRGTGLTYSGMEERQQELQGKNQHVVDAAASDSQAFWYNLNLPLLRSHN